MAANRRWMLLGIVALALVNGSGCLVVAGAAAAGAGAAGYAYVKGRYYRDYPFSLDDSFAAVRTGLTDLHFPIVHEERGTGRAYLESKTADGTKVFIDLDMLISRIPAEGQVTRIYIRVGSFGDEEVSARIFEQTALHFLPPGPAKLGTPTLAAPPAPPPIPLAAGNRPFETAAPPLAGGTQPATSGTPTAANPIKPVAAGK